MKFEFKYIDFNKEIVEDLSAISKNEIAKKASTAAKVFVYLSDILNEHINKETPKDKAANILRMLEYFYARFCFFLSSVYDRPVNLEYQHLFGRQGNNHIMLRSRKIFKLPKNKNILPLDALKKLELDLSLEFENSKKENKNE